MDEKKKKILVVDDEKVIADMIKNILESNGDFEVITADLGRLGLKEFQDAIESNNNFDLVISDIIMPGGILGTDVAEKIHEIDPDMPIVLISGYPGDGEDKVFDLSNKGVIKDFIKKPFSVIPFLNKIKKVLGLSPQE